MSKYIVFYLCDAVSVAISFLIALLLRFGKVTVYSGTPIYANLLTAYIIVTFLITSLFGLMDNFLRRGYLQEFIVTVVLAFSSLSGVTLILFSVKSSELISRLVLLYTALSFIIVDYLLCGILAKKLYRKYMIAAVRDENNQSIPAAFLVTAKGNAAGFIADVREAEFKPLRIKGIVFMDDCEPEPVVEGIRTINTLEESLRYICREWIDEIIIYLPQGSTVPETFVTHCREMGLTIHYVIDVRGVNRENQFVEEIGSHTCLTTVYNYISPRQAIVKRLFDIAGGLAGCVCTVLIGLVICPVIYIASPGPVIFRQKRVGKNGKIFYVLKFRSMYLDAEDRKKDLMTENRVSDGMMFKMAFDPRVIGNRILPDGTKKTGIGEFIRKTSLDEFPQFFNVLKGDMSLVGTRPPTVDEWEKYEYHHRARLAIKPGITGLWQISGRSEITDFEEVVRLDTEYITHFRLSSDLKILFKTVIVLIRRKGAM